MNERNNAQRREGQNVPVATNLHLPGPDVFSEPITPVLHQDRTVLMIDDAGYTVPNQKRSDTQAHCQANARDDGDPFLARIVLGQPWLRDLALLDTPGVEVPLRRVQAGG